MRNLNEYDKAGMNGMKIEEVRKEFFSKMEKMLSEMRKPEDCMFYCHSDEDRIVLSHALFWVMTRCWNMKVPSLKGLSLLCKYQEMMLEAYLTEADDYPELLRYCNIMYELLPYELKAFSANDRTYVKARKLKGIAIVAAGFGGDMPEELACELLDDMDFEYNRVCCHKIERMLPQLARMVEEESMFGN